MWQTRNTRRIVVTFAGAALIATASIVAAAPASAAQSGGEVDRARTDDLVTLVNKDRGTFGGISFDEKAGVATIRYVATDRADKARGRIGHLTQAASTSRSASQSWKVNLVPVQRSLSELDGIRQRVMEDAEWTKIADDLTSEFWIDITRNIVAVGLTKVTPEVAALAKSKFGDSVSLHTRAREARISRTDDFEPWVAGIRINTPVGGCTAGYVIRNNANPNLRRHVTAGHCGNLGNAVRNNGDLVGNILTRTLAQNGLDVATYGGRTYEAWMYTQGPTSNVGFPIKGGRVSAVGLSICTNGATSGENCNARVGAIDVCFTFSDGIRTCFLDRADSTNGSNIALGGDSGGPVITYDAAGLKIVGTIIGPAGTSTHFHWWAYTLPSGWSVDVS